MQKILSAVFTLLLSLSGPAAALSAAGSAEAPARVGIGAAKRDLTLAEAIERALKANLEIEIERTMIETAKEDASGARGYLDPLFRLSPQIEDRNIPTASPLLGAEGKLEQTLGTLSGSWDQRLPWWGSSLRVALENNRQTTTNPFEGLSPFNTARLGITATFPLLRNREIDRERAGLRITSKQVDLSGTAFEVKAIDVIARVQESYWNLVAARQNVMVTSEAVDLAREQLARTKRQIESGTLPEVELAAAEAELERRVDTWYASIGLVTTLENALKSLIAGSREETVWNEEIVPVEERMVEPPQAGAVREASDTAVAKRPELRLVDTRKEVNEIQAELARNQTRTQLHLVGGYSVAGLTGALASIRNPFSQSLGGQFARINELSELAGLAPLEPPAFGETPRVLLGGYGAMWQQVFEGRFPTAFAGVQIDFTARNRRAKAELAKTAVEERRLQLERRQIEQRIEAQVRNALQAIQTARQRITAAEASVRAAEEKLASEIRLFQTGESTNFLVLTRQNELADSRQRAVVARLDFNKAVAQAQQAMGLTLESYRITLSP